MKKLSLLSTLLLFLAGLLHAQTPNNAPKPTYKANQVLLKLSSGLDKWQHEATILDILAAQAGKITPIYGTDVQLVYLPDVLVIDGQSLHNPQQIADYFSRHPHPYLDYIEPNYLYNIATTPNDPHFDDQWGLHQANDRDIDAPEAWDMNHDCNDVVVGLLDSGIDWRHPDLIDNIWQNLGEDADNDGHVLELVSGVWQFDPGDINNADNDGNGYNDDFIGWDFANNDNNPMDDNGHGTHCGGIIGARGNNGIGVTGVCWDVKIMALKFLGSDGGGATSDATAALNYAVAKQATLTNNSWGGASSSVALQNAIANAQTHNQLFVTSAGNNSQNIDATPFYPANYSSDNIIVVAASTPSDNLAGFSNYGQANVDVLAPGVDIYSTQPNNTYGYESGTSQATAFVTGAAALAYCNNTTYTNLKNTLLNSIDVKLSMGTQCATGGRINVFKARANANCCTAAASFTASASTNCLGNLISFTNTSTNASTYQWTIDGTVQPYSNTISYNFTTGGEHTIALLASNGTCTDAAYQTLNTSDALTANFTHYENGLTAACFAPANNNTYQWNFGDGATSTNNNAVHTYTAAGTYNVCLTASNVCDTLQTCQSITVALITDCGNPTPGIEWQNTIGGNGYEQLVSIQQTSDGGYILGGYSDSGNSGDKTEACQGYYDYWVVKISATGTIEWQNTIGGSGDDILQSIQQTTDGGYILGGYSGSVISGDKTEASQGYEDYWVVKLSASGTIQWQNTIGGSATDWLQSIQQTTDGGYILGGSSLSGISGDKTQANKGSFDYWIVKLNATGQIQTQKTIGGSSADELQSIEQTTDGGYILGGYSSSGISGDKTEANQGESDYWVVKLSASGAIQWQNTIGGNDYDKLQSIRQTADGGYILGGYSKSGISGDKIEASQGGNFHGDYWVVKLSANGTIEWQNTIGGSGDDQLQSIQQTIDGGYILGGYSNSSISGDKTEANLGSLYTDDYWVVKLYNNGLIQWQNTIGGNYYDNLVCLEQNNDGSYLLGGYSGSGISGDKTQANKGGYDYWVIKLFSDFNNNGLSANFTTDINLCAHTLNVFNNISTGTTAYCWLIDDVPITNNKNLDYTFTSTGTKTIKLIATNGICSDTTSKIVNVTSSPNLAFTYTKSNLSIHFNALSLANNYTWDFGDGNIGTGNTLQHTYATLGTYQVCLNATMNCGNSSICQNITVNDTISCILPENLIGWQNTIGGNGYEQLVSIQQTTDGGYILGGYSNSNISGDKTEASQGGYDYWIVKLSATGTIQWQSTIGGNDYDYLQSIQQTTDGGYILGGYSYSGISGNKTEASQGGFDYWVVKLSANGTIEWQNTIGGSGDDYLQSIQQTTDGGYILGGYSQSGVSGDKTEACQGNYDYWVVKLTTTSAIEWQNTIGGSGDDRLQSIQQTTDGGYILGGYSESGISGDKTKTSQGDADYWVVKIAATGTIEWQNTIGGSIEDYLLSIQQTTDGGYILGGYSRSGISGDKTEANQGSSDYWVVKLSATGTIQWQNTIGGSSNDYLQSIQQTTDGGYILGGYSNSNISGDKTETSQGDSDYWVVKLTGTGTIEWQNTIGGSGDDRLQSIQQTTNGGYILGGYSNSSIYGDKIEISQGYEDYWILKLPSITFPISNFEIPINTCINQAIHFTNYSTNAGNYQWEINDTPITTMTDLDYTFTTSGTYTITLISNNPTYSSRKSQVVQIIDPYDFSYVQNGVTINFFAETGANEYSWNLGDETTSIGQNIIHTYLAEGTYEVCLSSNTCESLNTCRNIVVTQLPKCVFTPTIQWQNTIGGNSNDELQSIQQTTDGGYILGGYSNSNVSGDKTEASLYNDYWIVKLSVAGTIEWQNAIGGNQTDYLQSIQQTTDGGYILGGTSNSDISGDKTEPSQGNDDYWVVKLTATGAIEWQNTIGGSSIDRLKSIQQTTDGGYILGGYTASGISGDKTEALQGAYDYWIIKLTATGTIEWQNTIGGNNYDYLESIQQTTDGGYILGGYSASGISGDKTEASQGYEDYWVIKLTTTGAIEWQNTIGGSSGDYLRSIQQTTDGGYILGGYSNSGISGDKTEANQGSFDYWVIKLAATGAIEWQNTIGGSSNDYLQSIQQTTDGGYILGGYTASGISGDKTEANQGSFDYWVVKLAATGNIQWQNTIGGSSVDYLSDIQQTTDGGYILGGYSQSGISGDKTETSQGYTDYWVVKISGISTNPTIASFTLATNNLPTNSPYTYLYNPTNFTNLSSNATSYQWQIDGIPISTNTNLNYTFNTSGSHIVSLIASNEECSNMYSKTIVVLDAVWPGDANADGTVNMLDYLALGIAYNYVAIPRLEQNIDWNAKFATNFNQTFGGNLFANTNYKHSDCNGNGTINFADTTAILQNFGLSYLPATTLAPSVSPQALVSVEANTPYVAASTVAYLNIKLQNALDNNNSVNLYGMAFSIDYTGASNPQLDFTGSCLGTLGTDFIASYKIDDANKKIHVGITRFNHNNSLALGTVATLQLNINALPTGTSLAIGTENIVLCDNEGYRIPAAAGVAANMEVQTNASPVMLQAKALLQCALTDLNVGNALMTTEFNSTLPTQQPFNAAPWNYTGTESGTIPANAVDWVLVELRNSVNINQVVARKAVLLLNDGSLQDVGTPLQTNRVAFAGLANNQSYFVVLRHRSHQTIASSAAVPVSNNLMSIDFTQSADQTNGGAASLAYINGMYALKLVLTPTLSGNTAVCSGTTQTYTNSTPVAGVTYTWTATGGSIVSGQGSNSVQIQWANGTSGTLTLTAEERLCSEVASASITVSLTPDAIVTVGGTAAGGGTPGLTSYNLCPTCKVYLKSNYTNLTNYTLKWYKNNNELTQYQNYLGGYVKKAGNYKLKVIRNSTGCEDFSQTVTVTGGAPMLTDNNNPNINNTPSMGKEEELLFESENLELFVYPNPAQNRVTIAYNIADNNQLSLKIYDIMGQLQHAQTLAISNNTLDVDVSTYPSGTYLVQLLGDKASVVSYLMVVK